MQKISILVSTFIAVLLVLIAAKHSYEQETEVIKTRLSLLVTDKADDLYQRVQLDLELLQGLKSIFQQKTYITSAQFNLFTKGALLRHPSIQALAWVQKVPAEKREYLENKRKAQYPDFEFTERNRFGDLVRRGPQHEYFPVSYVEPYVGNELALGFDTASSALRYKTLKMARDTGEMLSTETINLLQVRNNQHAFLTFAPVYEIAVSNAEQRREALKGFVLGVFKIKTLMAQIVDEADKEQFTLSLLDVSDTSDIKNIFQQIKPSDYDENLKYIISNDLVSLGSHAWQLTAVPTSLFVNQHRSNAPLLMIVLGGLLLLITALSALFYNARTQKIHILVKQRTKELETANQSLSEAESRHRAVLDNMLDGIFTIDVNGIIQYCNHTAPTMFGYKTDDLIGSNISMLMPEPLRSAHDGYLKQYVKSGKANIIGIGRDVVGLHKDGRPIDVFLSITQVKQEGEIFFTGLLHDRTEQKAYEEGLKQSNQALKDASRLKSDFLANMSHELRTPMNSILGFTGRVIKKSGYLLPDQQLKNLHTVDRNARHLLALINDLLDISKIEAGRMDVYIEPFDLERLIREVIRLNHTLAEDKGLELTVVFPEIPIEMHSDQQKVKHILINLLSNAIKFTDSGSVQLKVGSPKKLTDENYWLSIEVIDTGIGIDISDHRKVFEAFRQADGSSTRLVGGTGLGLTISQRLAKLLEGELKLESSPELGSTFTLSLPVNMTGDYPVFVQERMGDFVGHGPLVLCIDDDPDAVNLIREILIDEGYQVVVAQSADAGLAKAKSLQPAAITLDILMPDKDGWQLLHELKEESLTKNIPVIMVSVIENKEWGYRLGAVDYLLKPVDVKELIASLDRLRNPATILIVDDDLDVQNLLSQYFKDENQNIKFAENGQQALEILSARRPDLILLDLLMPVMDGFEFLKKLDEVDDWRSIPVIIMTAKDLSPDEKELLNNRVEAVILKDGLSTEQLMKLVVAQVNQLTGKS